MCTAILLLLCCLFGTSSQADMTVFGLVYGEPNYLDNNGTNPLLNTDVRFDLDGTVITATTDSQGYYEAHLPMGTEVTSHPVPSVGLFQNYPNPFNPTTVIPFSLAEPSDITLSVYNTLGQHVRTLINGFHDRGRHTCMWDGRDDTGRTVSAGVYMYRLKTGDTAVSSKMLLIDGGASSNGGAYHIVSPSVTAKSTVPKNRCIMTIETDGFLAWADTFTVYEDIKSHKDVIMNRKGGAYDVMPDYPIFDINWVWGDDNGSEGHTPIFQFEISEDTIYKSYTTKENGVVARVPWSYSNVDSVYITITESPKPERINLTIPIIFHFWMEMNPVVTNLDELSDGILDVEVMALKYLVVGKSQSQTKTGGSHE